MVKMLCIPQFRNHLETASAGTTGNLNTQRGMTYLTKPRRYDSTHFHLGSLFSSLFLRTLFIFREGKGEKEWEGNINVWLPLARPLLEAWFAGWHSVH